MKAKIWFLLLSLCGILSACGNDGVTYVTTDSFLNKNSISDVRYLAVSGLQVGENEILYYGARKDLDWFALFDKSSGLLLKEWYGQRLSIAIPDGDVALIGGFTYRGKNSNRARSLSIMTVSWFYCPIIKKSNMVSFEMSQAC